MPNQTREFFQALYADKPAQAAVCVWRLEGRHSEWFTDPDMAADYAIANFEYDLYAQIGIGQEPLGEHKRLTADQVIGLPALWIDFDIEGDAHQKKNLPRTVTEALGILPPIFPPSMVVASGYGAHAYWLLKEMELFAGVGERRRAAQLLKLWERLIRLRAHTKGWTIDATHDLARILRIPGTKNNKLREQGIIADCLLIDLNERRYNLADFEEALAGVPGLNDDPQVAANAVAIPRPVMQDLRLTQDREFEKLQSLLNSKEFAAIWNHQRPDLKDQSQSSYDLAIANMLFKAGVNDQDSVDAMIHNRRLHGAKTKMRPDYYQRTLAKARIQFVRGCTVAQVMSEAVTEIASPKPETSPEQKGLMYEKLSCLLNLKDANQEPNILRVVKVTGEKPTWRIELKNGQKISIQDADDVLEQRRMKKIIWTATNRRLPSYSREEWQTVVDEFGKSLVEVPAGGESTATGELHYYLELYLTAAGVSESPEDALGDIHALMQPFEYQGSIAIQANELRDWLARYRNERLEISDVLNRLSAIGATRLEFDVEEGRAPQSRWILPEMFVPVTWRRISIEAHAQAAKGRGARTVQ